MITERERLERQGRWDTYRRELMAKRAQMRLQAVAAAEDEPVWHVDPPLQAPAWFERPEASITLLHTEPVPAGRVVDEVVQGRNAIGQVVKGHQPERLLTVEEQFRKAEGRDQDQRLAKIRDGFKAALRGKESL